MRSNRERFRFASPSNSSDRDMAKPRRSLRAAILLSLLAATAAVPFALAPLDEASAMGFGHFGGGGFGHFQPRMTRQNIVAPRTNSTSFTRMRGTGDARSVNTVHSVSHDSGRFGKDRDRGSRVATGNGKYGGDRGRGSGETGKTGTGTHIANGGRYPGSDGRPPRWPHRPNWPIVTGGGAVISTPVIGATLPVISGGGGGGGTNLTPPTNVTRRPGTGVPAGGEQRYVKDEVVVEVANFLTNDAADTLARRHRLARLQSVGLPLVGTTLLRMRITDRRSVPVVVRELERDVTILSAQPNFLYSLVQDGRAGVVTPASFAPASLGDPAQYAIGKLNLAQAHAMATGEKVLVAIIDSGIDATHPDLAGDVAASYDALGNGEKIQTHGTAVAGVIAAHGKLLGAAPRARLLTIRAFGGAAASDGTTVAIAAGVNWAVAQGARVINMSFAGPQDRAVAFNLAAAADHGVVLVAAAGNKGPKSPAQFPASDSHVIAVTATDEDDKLFPAANRGRHIAVAAPGVDIVLLAPHNEVQYSSGTSFSAPYVSGTVALMLERRPDLTPDAVKKILMTTARDLGPKGFDDQFGAGLVDAQRALLAVEPATVGVGAVGANAVPSVVPASINP